jgi:hypothetical protein
VEKGLCRWGVQRNASVLLQLPTNGLKFIPQRDNLCAKRLCLGLVLCGRLGYLLKLGACLRCLLSRSLQLSILVSQTRNCAPLCCDYDKRSRKKEDDLERCADFHGVLVGMGNAA